MSRTDAHRPYDVWIADEPRLVREHHDHSVHACPRDAGRLLPVDAAAACHLELDSRVRLCGCPLCSGSYWGGVADRARRCAERALTRAAARGADPLELERLEATADRRGR
jgi:hypothetical protein